MKPTSMAVKRALFIKEDSIEGTAITDAWFVYGRRFNVHGNFLGWYCSFILPLFEFASKEVYSITDFVREDVHGWWATRYFWKLDLHGFRTGSIDYFIGASKDMNPGPVFDPETEKVDVVIHSVLPAGHPDFAKFDPFTTYTIVKKSESELAEEKLAKYLKFS